MAAAEQGCEMAWRVGAHKGALSPGNPLEFQGNAATIRRCALRALGRRPPQVVGVGALDLDR